MLPLLDLPQDQRYPDEFLTYFAEDEEAEEKEPEFAEGIVESMKRGLRKRIARVTEGLGQVVEERVKAESAAKGPRRKLRFLEMTVATATGWDASGPISLSTGFDLKNAHRAGEGLEPDQGVPARLHH